MKAVAYSVRPFEKEYFARANQKKHEITLIANPLDTHTLHYAEGKDAIIIQEGLITSPQIADKLSGLGIKYIITRPSGNNNVELQMIAAQMINDLDTADGNNRLLQA